MNLELMAMSWLRFERRCPLVLRERSPRQYCCGRPDVLGITLARYMIEVEIKRSYGDFVADGQKLWRRGWECSPNMLPKQFYFFAIPKLADRIRQALPPWAGLMTVVNDCGAGVVVKAPVNSGSRRLKVKECLKLVHLLSNHVISAEEKCESIMSGWRFGHEPYWGEDYQI